MAAWKKNEEKAKLEGGKVGRMPTKPTQAGESSIQIGSLYEANVHPYVPYAIRGVLWDQGEGGTAITGVDQFHVMGALIKGWRKAWGKDFPFLYVQKPSGGGTAWDLENPVTKNAAHSAPLPEKIPGNIEGLLREVHIKIQQYSNTAMVTSTDLGGGTHPVNKAGYAERAVRVAMGFVYGKKVEISGPLYASHVIEGNKVRVTFTHVGQGLAVRHSDKVQGFMIAGADKTFVWAEATIEGDCVIVSSAQVAKPVALRYAWSGNSPWANLFNKDGLPAQTFRTDDWK
jgi:sialate O-acetylesterase